ncbi:MAG: futalosine hydrolase [Vulcanimicrobiaceae bacterium]
MILVVCALATELRYFTAPAGVTVLAGGVGPVEAAIAVANALARAPYDLVLHAGIAGAYRDAARIGDARLVARDALADFGLEGGGDLALPQGTLVTCVDADAALLERLRGTRPACGGLTVAAVTTTDATAARLRTRYGHDVETMEGFAILRAARVAGVPAIGIRGISNYVGDRATSEWDFVAGARSTAAALADAIARLADTSLA